MYFRLLILLIFSCQAVLAQDITLLSQDITINRYIDGTLLIPDNSKTQELPLAIIVAGSGPTDRDGNQNFMQNNVLKKLSEELSKNRIATFRFDKRSVKLIKQGNMEEEIMFDDFITDAISALTYFKTKYKFKEIYFVGHDQGSLVGMIAAREGADGFISIAGLGKPINEVIIDQLNQTAPMYTEDATNAFSIITQGQTTTDFPSALASFLSIDIQPFMGSWMRYSPQEQIKNLQIPTLIINGTNDIQVPVSEAQLLHDNSNNSKLVFIDEMNHVLVTVNGDDLDNSKTYNDSKRKISKQLIKTIVNFISKE